ncbi:MAG: hypothetical protein ACOYXR_00975 [Nitrospirota bacterium]
MLAHRAMLRVGLDPSRRVKLRAQRGRIAGRVARDLKDRRRDLEHHVLES